MSLKVKTKVTKENNSHYQKLLIICSYNNHNQFLLNNKYLIDFQQKFHFVILSFNMADCMFAPKYYCVHMKLGY